GRPDQDGAYIKETTGSNAERGAVYVVAGSSGWATFGSLDHPAMYASYLEMGSLVVDVDGSRLDAKFLTLDGRIDDYFTIVKSGSDFRFTTIRFANGDVLLRWASQPSRRYRIEHTPDLSESFIPVSPPILADSSETTW